MLFRGKERPRYFVCGHRRPRHVTFIFCLLQSNKALDYWIKSMYIGLYKTPNKALFCLVLSCLKRYCDINSLRKHSFLLALRRWKRFARRKRPQRRRARRNGCFRRLRHQWDCDYQYSLVFLSPSIHEGDNALDKS